MNDVSRRPESAYYKQMEQSLLVPIIMLAVLHARDIEIEHAPLLKAAEALYDFAQHASEFCLWWSTEDQRDAKKAAEQALQAFARRDPLPALQPQAGKVIGFPDGEAS